MPNLGFSPVPHASTHEKENGAASSTPAGGKRVDLLPHRRSGSTDSRSPLEIISAEGEPSAPTACTPSAGMSTGPLVCKRDSSCTCPDCAAAASSFSINELRQVGSSAAGGRAESLTVAATRVARSPLVKSVTTRTSSTPTARDREVVASSSSSPSSSSPRGVKVADAAAISTPVVTAELDGGEAAAPGNDTEADTVLDNHEERQADIAAKPAEGEIVGTEGEVEIRDGDGPAATTEVDTSGASVGVAAAALSCSQPLKSVTMTETVRVNTAATTSTVRARGQPPALGQDGGRQDNGLMRQAAYGCVDALLSDGEEEHGDDGEDDVIVGDDVRRVAAADGGTCAPPFMAPPESHGQVTLPVEPGVGQQDAGRRSSRRLSSSSRRLSLQPDMFFECTSEVDQMPASDGSESEASSDDEDERNPELVREEGGDEEGSEQENGVVFGDDRQTKTSSSSPPAKTFVDSSHPAAVHAAFSPMPSAESVIKGGSPCPAVVAALEAAVSAHVQSPARLSAAGLGGVGNASSLGATLAADDGEVALGAVLRASAEGGVRAAPETVRGPVGRRRNRRHMPQMELGLGAGAYEDDDARPRFSQLEVNAKIRERLAEENALFEKTLSDLKAGHAAQLAEAAAELRQSSNAGSRAMIAAKDTEALEQEIAMLSERFGEAAGEARAKGKALIEKETLLDAVTAQLMGLKTELASIKTSHTHELQRLGLDLESERKQRATAESSLAELEVAYNRLEDEEREKRANGILKMKKDMQALAQAQFRAANKKHYAVQARLESAEKEVKQLQEAAKRHEDQLRAAGERAEGFRNQVESLENDRARSVAEAAQKEKMLREELDASRAVAGERMDEVEHMSRELAAAKKAHEVSKASFARVAISNTQMKEEISDLEGKVRELEGFCTQALDELDAAKAEVAALKAGGSRM